MAEFNRNRRAYTTLLIATIEDTKDSLLAAGISEDVIKPIETLLRQTITSGGNIADLTALLKDEILGTANVDGKLLRHTKQITRDSLNQFNANYTQVVSKDLGLQFYTYQGLIVDASRDYCKRRVAEGRWFHIKEIEKTASEVWGGKIASTNKSNILIHRGGHNCNHIYLGVSILAVPMRVIKRAISKGFITKEEVVRSGRMAA